MKNSTDRKAAGVPELNAREMFALRCLNAAVNLYGILTVDECVRLYNHYAKGKPAPVSDEMTVEEFVGLVEHLSQALGDAFENPNLSPNQYARLPRYWFSTWIGDKTSPDLIAYYDLTSVDDDLAPEITEEKRAQISRRLQETRAEFVNIDLNLLPEKEFLDYEEPAFVEETEEACDLVKFLQSEYHLEEGTAAADVMGILSNARLNGAACTEALEYVRDTFGWRPQGSDQLLRLVKALSPALCATRLWRGRGRSTSELCKMGLVEKIEKENIPVDIFDDDEESETSRMINGWRSGCDDDYEDDEEEGDPILPEDIPLSVYNGPIDFKFVKDSAKRAEKMSVYADVRDVLDDFCRDYIAKLWTKSACEEVASRFGLHAENGVYKGTPLEFGMFLAEFSMLLDDQAEETLCQHALANRKDFDEIDKRVATYYENFRFTWLEVLAVKAGVGMKCRDLLTGEELFLMDEELSLRDMKGKIVIADIAPMEDVYVPIGITLPFPGEKVVLGQALERLGIPTERPIRLPFDQQRKLAAETIRAYVALRGA